MDEDVTLMLDPVDQDYTVVHVRTTLGTSPVSAHIKVDNALFGSWLTIDAIFEKIAETIERKNGVDKQYLKNRIFELFRDCIAAKQQT